MSASNQGLDSLRGFLNDNGISQISTEIVKNDVLMKWSDVEVSQTAYGGDYTFLNSSQIELDGTYSKSDLVKFIDKMKD